MGIRNGMGDEVRARAIPLAVPAQVPASRGMSTRKGLRPFGRDAGNRIACPFQVR